MINFQVTPELTRTQFERHWCVGLWVISGLGRPGFKSLSHGIDRIHIAFHKAEKKRMQAELKLGHGSRLERNRFVLQ